MKSIDYDKGKLEFTSNPTFEVINYTFRDGVEVLRDEKFKDSSLPVKQLYDCEYFYAPLLSDYAREPFVSSYNSIKSHVERVYYDVARVSIDNPLEGYSYSGIECLHGEHGYRKLMLQSNTGLASLALEGRFCDILPRTQEEIENDLKKETPEIAEAFRNSWVRDRNEYSYDAGANVKIHSQSSGKIR